MIETPPGSERPAPSATEAGEGRGVVFQALLVLGGLAALMFLLVEMQAALSPLVVGVAGVALLWPVRETKAARAILIAGGLLVGLYVVRTLAGVLAPFLGVFVLACLLNPAVTAAQTRWRIPRWASAGLATAVAVGVLVAVVLLLVPAIIGQVQSLAAAALGLVAEVPAFVAETRALDSIEAAGLIDRDALVAELATFLPGQIQAAAARIPALAVGLTRSVGAVIGVVTITALLPVLLFYTLTDYVSLRDDVVRLLPRWRGDRAYVTHIAHVMGSYLRGQLTISALSALLVAVPLTLLGVPFSILLGLLAGLLNMIPSLGSILTYVLSVALMLAFGTVGDVVIVLVVLAVQAIIEQAVLTPKIMSEQVGLHPVVVMLSLFVFSAFFGLIGFVLAVPTTALIAKGIRATRDAVVVELAPETTIVTPG